MFAGTTFFEPDTEKGCEMKRKQKAREAKHRVEEAKRLAAEKAAAEAARQLQLETERAAQRAPILAAAEIKFVELVTQYNDCVNSGRVDLACGRLNTAKAMAVEAREWRNAARNLVRDSGLNATQFNCSREPVAELEKAIETKEAQIVADKAARAAAEMEKLRQEAIAAEAKRFEEQEKLRAESLRGTLIERLRNELKVRWDERKNGRNRCALCVKWLADEARANQASDLEPLIKSFEAFLAVGEQRFGIQLGIDCGHRDWADVIKPIFHSQSAKEIEVVIETHAKREDEQHTKRDFVARVMMNRDPEQFCKICFSEARKLINQVYKPGDEQTSMFAHANRMEGVLRGRKERYGRTQLCTSHRHMQKAIDDAPEIEVPAVFEDAA